MSFDHEPQSPEPTLPDDSAELYLGVKTHADWHDDVVKLEALRDVIAAEHLQRGTEVDADADYNFVLGKLSVAQDQLTAYAAQNLINRAEDIVDKK